MDYLLQGNDPPAPRLRRASKRKAGCVSEGRGAPLTSSPLQPEDKRFNKMTRLERVDAKRTGEV